MIRRTYLRLASYIERRMQIDARYFLSGSFWLFFAQGCTVLFSLVVAVLFARYLPEADYGVYRYVIGLSVLLTAFSLTGVGQAITQAAAKGVSGFFAASTRTTLLYGLGVTASALLLAGYYFVQENTTLALGCLLIAALQPLTQLFSTSQAQLYGQKRFQPGSILQVGKSFLVSASSVAALFVTQNILWLLLVFFLAQAVTAVLTFLYVRYCIPTDHTTTTDYEKSISFAKHTSVRNWFLNVANQADNVIVFQQLGAAQLALYAVASILPTHIRGSFKNMQTLLLPKFARHDTRESIKSVIFKRSVQFFLFLCVCTVALLLTAPFIYSVLFPTYPEAVWYTQLLALSFPAAIALIPLSALQTLRMERELYILQIGTSALQLLLLVTLLFWLGLLGVVIAKIAFLYSRAMIAYFLLLRR